MISCNLALYFLASLSPAQAIGGEAETLFQWDGGRAFGYCVAEAGDVNADGIDDVIVGAYASTTTGLPGPGSVYVYSGATGLPIHQWDSPSADDSIGRSVAGAGDVNADGFDDVIVGAPNANRITIWGTGSAFVYSGADGTLLYRWDGFAERDNFGAAVSGAGDLNGDGYSDVLIGASWVDHGAFTDAGSVYAYSGADGSLLHEWQGTSYEDHCGGAVSGAGDVNQDGFDDVLVGIAGADVGHRRDCGAVFVFSGADGSPLRKWTGASADDRLGISVANAGNINGDGFPDTIIGAFQYFSGPFQATGAAFVFSGFDGDEIHRWEGEHWWQNLGHCVSGAGDVNGDGFSDLIVGAPRSGLGLFEDVGSALLYSGADGLLLHRWDGEAENDRFGFSVSSAGDFNGDGHADLIVGAYRPGYGSQLNDGSAYLLSFQPFLRPDKATISASIGGVLHMDLDFPDAAAFHKYKILISGSGIGPTLFGVDIPLTLDNLVGHTFIGDYPVAVSNNMHGTLDAFGDAAASLTLLAASPSGLIGRSYFLAAIANPPGQLPLYSSVACRIEITP